jgi:hypothetical protein
VEENFAFAARPLIYEKHRLVWKHRAPLTVYFHQPSTAFDLHLQVAQ